MDGGQNNLAIGQFNLGGWGTGNGSPRGNLSIVKEDSDTNTRLSGAVFKFTHKVFSSESFVLKTDENGQAFKKDVIAGVYDVEEIVVPNGYVGMDKKEVLIVFNDQREVELKFKNDAIPFDLSVSKTWIDDEGNQIHPQIPIVFKLFADGELIRQVVMPKNQYKLTFVGLKKFNVDGELIDYKLYEEAIKGYESSIDYHQENQLFNVVNSLIPLEINDPLYPNEEVVPEETVEDLEIEEVTPVV
ncbi:Cna B-type domain-containing protein, partial [Erysipelothrix urinaevulpis]